LICNEKKRSEPGCSGVLGDRIIYRRAPRTGPGALPVPHPARYSSIIAAFIAGVALLHPTVAFGAQPDGGSSPKAEPQKKAGQRSIPRILDTAYRHPKRHQLELTIFGGSYLGAHLKSSWLAGVRAYFHFDHMFALGAAYGTSQLAPSARENFGGAFDERTVHFVDGELSISNAVAMRVGKTLLELDLYLTVGAGAMRLNANWEFLGVIGGGIKVYTPVSWLAVRVDLNTFLHRTRRLDVSSIDGDITLTLGLSFLLPPRKRR
jgi:hypothetical protein